VYFIYTQWWFWNNPKPTAKPATAKPVAKPVSATAKPKPAKKQRKPWTPRCYQSQNGSCTGRYPTANYFVRAKWLRKVRCCKVPRGYLDASCKCNNAKFAPQKYRLAKRKSLSGKCICLKSKK